ncbi:MAG: Gfo/Idh/MocA family oxidoreductase [Deltaproteobacteria bacterium]|nr:Gfo/Idh/MocA family oxidoreductase [Deltaproteobacteria bacterium]
MIRELKSSGIPHGNLARLPHRVGVIGLGAHGLAVIEQLLSHPDTWSIVGVVDSSRASYARFQWLYHDRCIPCFTTPAELMRFEEIAVILISTTAPAHVSIAESLISSGYCGHILIEKPISNSLVQATRLADLVQTTNWPGRIGVNFSRRCSALYSQVKETIGSGELGRLLRMEYHQPCKISMKGSHYVDLANWFLVSEPSRVSARLDRFSVVDHRGAFFFDPAGCIEVTYQNGAVFSMDTTGANQALTEGLTVIGERGEVYVDVEESFVNIKSATGERKSLSDKVGYGYNWIENTLEALISDHALWTPCTLGEAIAGLEIMVAAHVSDRLGGQPVELPLNSQFCSEVLRVA